MKKIFFLVLMAFFFLGCSEEKTIRPVTQGKMGDVTLNESLESDGVKVFLEKAELFDGLVKVKTTMGRTVAVDLNNLLVVHLRAVNSSGEKITAQIQTYPIIEGGESKMQGEVITPILEIPADGSMTGSIGYEIPGGFTKVSVDIEVLGSGEKKTIPLYFKQAK